jgi:glycosyltransferase involved in cell wall biosynthesis
LVETGDVQSLAGAITRYLSVPELARRHGRAGRDRVERWFRRERVWEAWLGEYHRLALERWGEGERVEGRRAAP